MMGKKKTAMKRGGAVKKRGGGMMGPKKKMAKGGVAKRMGGGMMGPKKKMARGGDPAKEIAKTKIGLHKLDAMGMLGAGKAAGKGLKGLMGKMAGAAGKAIRKKKKQGYKAREDEALGMRRGKESGKKQSMKDRRNESYGKFGKRPNQKINRRGGGVAQRGMGKAK
jgi:hypothetical protein